MFHCEVCIKIASRGGMQDVSSRGAQGVHVAAVLEGVAESSEVAIGVLAQEAENRRFGKSLIDASGSVFSRDEQP